MTQTQQQSNQNTQIQESSVIKFLQSDATLHIAIVLALLGSITMGVFIFLLEGMARIHMSVVTFLFTGLFLSLFFFKGLKNEGSDMAEQKLEVQIQDDKTKGQ